VAGGWVVHGWEPDIGPEVDVGESLQQLRRSTFYEARSPMDDEVLLQAGRLELGALDRECDPRVTGNVPELPQIRREMSRDDLVSVQSHPDARHLR
jgi:hypothetical protein